MHSLKGITKRRIPNKLIEQMIVRKPVMRLDKIHPRAKKVWNSMLKEPQPLKYKLQDLPEPDFTLQKPLGTMEDLPFHVDRTYTGNIPVYTDYKCGRSQKLTVVRRVSGDIEEFKSELVKVVSNSEILEKAGSVHVKGIHSQKIKLWLRRLGF